MHHNCNHIYHICIEAIDKHSFEAGQALVDLGVRIDPKYCIKPVRYHPETGFKTPHFKLFGTPCSNYPKVS